MNEWMSLLSSALYSHRLTSNTLAHWQPPDLQFLGSLAFSRSLFLPLLNFKPLVGYLNCSLNNTQFPFQTGPFAALARQNSHQKFNPLMLLSHKKNEILPFAATWVDLEIIILSEVTQTEKDKYHMISLICGIWKIIQINIFTKQKQTHRHRKLTVTKGEAGEG